MSSYDNNDATDGVIIDQSSQRKPLTATVEELKRMLQVIQDEILPKTTLGVQNGNKVFGAAVLSDDFSKTITADTNEETTCPIFHGEVHVLVEWSKQVPAAERGPAAQSSVFLSTHEPCCMCISSIVWAGFAKLYYFFPYTITTQQGIPHDIQTMHELWGVNSYRKQNKYCSATCIMDLIADLDNSVPEKKELLEKQQELMDQYNLLSNKYHTEKLDNANNSLVLG